MSVILKSSKTVFDGMQRERQRGGTQVLSAFCNAASYAAAEYGCKYIYFIIDEDNSLKEELEGQESDSSDKLEFRYIYSLEEIAKA